MGGNFALLIGNTDYTGDFEHLSSPKHDVERLAKVLENPTIGGYNVQPLLINSSSPATKVVIEDFFNRRERGDLLLLYFSGHGHKHPIDGALYLIATNTYKSQIRSTGIEARFIRDLMRDCRAERQIIILDCCYSGSIDPGKSGEIETVEIEDQFFDKANQVVEEPENEAGRYILTASSATQLAFEKVIPGSEYSIYTHFLLEGLEKGKAAPNGDQEVRVSDLHEYIEPRVRNARPNQQPRLWVQNQQQPVVIAKNPFPAGNPQKRRHEIERLRQTMEAHHQDFLRGNVLLNTHDIRKVREQAEALQIDLTSEDEKLLFLSELSLSPEQVKLPYESARAWLRETQINENYRQIVGLNGAAALGIHEDGEAFKDLRQRAKSSSGTERQYARRALAYYLDYSQQQTPSSIGNWQTQLNVEWELVKLQWNRAKRSIIALTLKMSAIFAFGAVVTGLETVTRRPGSSFFVYCVLVPFFTFLLALSNGVPYLFWVRLAKRHATKQLAMMVLLGGIVSFISFALIGDRYSVVTGAVIWIGVVAANHLPSAREAIRQWYIPASAALLAVLVYATSLLLFKHESYEILVTDYRAELFTILLITFLYVRLAPTLATSPNLKTEF